MRLDAQRRRMALAGAAALAGCAAPPLTEGPQPVPGRGEQGPAADRAPGPGGNGATDFVPGLPAHLQPPPSPREFRAAWVASVANIDWPSRPGLPNTAWRAEAIALLDRAKAIGLNAIVLQVRPAADALYASSIEPWSEYLTGIQGRAPSPAEDPLALWVAEAHKRGLELHAWFNPYRAKQVASRSPLAANHIALAKPHAVKRYGDLLWMDPAEPDAVAQTIAVVADVVRRYDIDAVHIDDYFYPYPVAVDGVDQAFPDDPAWLRYLAGGGTLERADWRREQVDGLVEALYRKVHEIKPAVRFGISPFGIGKPALRPEGITGFSQYDKLYADVERWLERGWLDYLAPQLYWPITRTPQAFEVLLDYWLTHNPRGRHIWPGLFTSMLPSTGSLGTAITTTTTTTTDVGSKAWPAAEILTQIERVRTRPESSGHLHFSMSALMQDRDGIATRLRAGPCAQDALVPATPWLGGARPLAPRLQKMPGAAVAIRSADGGAKVFVWSLWRRRGSGWRFEVLPSAEAIIRSAGDELVVLRGVDALGVEGEAAVLWPNEASAKVISVPQRP